MTKRTQAEIDALIAEAKQLRESAPVMEPEAAKRMRKKWNIDSRSWTPEMFKNTRGTKD